MTYDAKQKLDSFKFGYLTSAIVAAFPPDGGPYGVYDIDSESRAQHEQDCQNFFTKQAFRLARVQSQHLMMWEVLGTGFFKSRNRLPFFFDLPEWGDEGAQLVEASHQYPPVTLVVGEDNKLYFEETD